MPAIVPAALLAILTKSAMIGFSLCMECYVAMASRFVKGDLAPGGDFACLDASRAWVGACAPGYNSIRCAAPAPSPGPPSGFSTINW